MERSRGAQAPTTNPRPYRKGLPDSQTRLCHKAQADHSPCEPWVQTIPCVDGAHGQSRGLRATTRWHFVERRVTGVTARSAPLLAVSARRGREAGSHAGRRGGMHVTSEIAKNSGRCKRASEKIQLHYIQHPLANGVPCLLKMLNATQASPIGWPVMGVGLVALSTTLESSLRDTSARCVGFSQQVLSRRSPAGGSLAASGDCGLQRLHLRRAPGCCLVDARLPAYGCWRHMGSPAVDDLCPKVRRSWCS